MIRLLPLFILLSGCPRNVYKGVTGTWAQDQYTAETKQQCINGAEAVKIADLYIVKTLDVLHRNGYIKDYYKAAKDAKFKVCLVQYPEACTLGSWTISKGARKRGCSSRWHAWGSTHWPFLCSEQWKDEPYCVNDKNKITTEGWREAFIHEIFNMCIQRWTDICDPSYGHEIFKLEKEL